MNSPLVEHIVELLAGWAPVRARPMFGGTGLYRDGLMFAIVADETLYFKTDARNRPDFQARDLHPFEYEKQGKRIQVAYYEAPAEALENPDEMRRWADSAFGATVRAARQKTGKR